MEDKEMFWTILWIALGVTCLYLAGRILTKVDVAKLGKYSSRFLAVFLAFLGYYGVTALSNIVPQLTLNPVRFELFKYAVPIAGAVALIYYGWKVHENWKTEINSLVQSSIQLLAIVVLAAFARFFFSL